MSIQKDCMTIDIHVGMWLGYKLDKAKTKYQLDVFPGSRHGFHFPEREAYNTFAAEQSWAKIVAMWDRNLK